MLQQAFDELAARIFIERAAELHGVARQQHLALDVDEQRGDVDELARGVDVGFLELVRVLQELRGDAADGDVVDVDVLLADEVEQEVERAVVDLADGDGERRLRLVVPGFFLRRGLGLHRRRRGRMLQREGRRGRCFRYGFQNFFRYFDVRFVTHGAYLNPQ